MRPSSPRELVAAGFDDDVASGLAEAGGGDLVRRDASDGSALRLLSESGIDPWQIHEQLVALGDPGLRPQRLPASLRTVDRRPWPTRDRGTCQRWP